MFHRSDLISSPSINVPFRSLFHPAPLQIQSLPHARHQTRRSQSSVSSTPTSHVSRRLHLRRRSPNRSSPPPIHLRSPCPRHPNNPPPHHPTVLNPEPRPSRFSNLLPRPIPSIHQPLHLLLDRADKVHPVQIAAATVRPSSTA